MALNISIPLYFELIMETIYGWGNDGAGVSYDCHGIFSTVVFTIDEELIHSLSRVESYLF